MNNRQLADGLKRILNLRWLPVAMRLMRPGEEVPRGVYEPEGRIRHCQSIALARRGNSMYLPPRRHACPDGAAILGLVPMSPKLRSGELYLLFKKLPNLECAQKMIASRPEFPAGSYAASVVAPLEEAEYQPDVVIFTLWPEQAMWLCAASTYATGERQEFQTSGYNSTCADLTVKVMTSQKMNISFGCYGARASSDVEDFEVYVSVPYGNLISLAGALEKLAVKSIPEARRRIYMPPVLDKVAISGEKEALAVDIVIDAERCSGCGLCAAFCPEALLYVRDDKGKKTVEVKNASDCCVCYTCAGQCPNKAIQLRVLSKRPREESRDE
ncbi:MAG: putative ArCR [Firmicutes bacterium]|nr:putative ArCR [Bacillota bacterium]